MSEGIKMKVFVSEANKALKETSRLVEVLIELGHQAQVTGAALERLEESARVSDDE